MPSKWARAICARVCKCDKLKIVERVVVVLTGQRSPKNQGVITKYSAPAGTALISFSK